MRIDSGGETTKGPVASRPEVPGYGIPENPDTLLPWSHVTERLASAKNYWIGTVGADGRPHAMPVWGGWAGDTLLFGAGPRTARNLAENPNVVVHLESGDDVVVLEGAATEATITDPELAARLRESYKARYDWEPDEVSGWVLQPRVAYAWSRFPEDATRFRFGAG